MEKLYLGVARETITPEIGCQLYGYRPTLFSDSVADDLTVTAFYFKQGQTQALMLTITVCLINTAVATEIAGLIEERFGIPWQSCMISATHTHSGPNTNGQEGWGSIDRAYVDGTLIPGILAAVEKAIENSRSVTMGCASGNSFVGINRRELTEDNSVHLGQNPWGCFNPRMTVLSFKDEEDKVAANLIHYGCHGTAAGPNKEITRDWAGVMTDELERFSGAPTAFFNGPEGDVGPRLSNGKTTGLGDIRYVYELGHVAAQDAVRIYKEIYDYRTVSLVSGGDQVLVPFKSRLSLEEAHKLYEQYKDETVNIAGAIGDYARKVLEAYEQGEPELDGMTIRQTVLALGNVVFVSFPYELFSEIGMRIDRCFSDKRILSLSNTNGSEGYFVTEDALCRGGYEVSMFQYGQAQPYCDHADYELMRRSVQHINNVLEEE